MFTVIFFAEEVFEKVLVQKVPFLHIFFFFFFLQVWDNHAMLKFYHSFLYISTDILDDHIFQEFMSL